MIICLDSFSKQNFKYLGISRLISVFQMTAMLKFANSQHNQLAPFAKFLGSMIRL